MVDIINQIINSTVEIIKHTGPLAGFLIIILESIIPVLPLAVFIALNNMVFGPLLGFVISWLATIIGCMIAFYAFRLGFSKILYRNIRIDGKAQQIIKFINKISFTQLTLLTALPFAPAFLINISAGLANISARRFLLSILIGKLSIVYFWGYIGTSFLESVSNPKIIIQIAIILGITYIISLLVQKYFNKEEGNKWNI